ncbi:MAG: class I SAM-dependent methyltransferase [Sandaracinaceae bacterium]
MSRDLKFWNGIAESYAKKKIGNVPAYERKLVITKDRLRPEHRVLDIGCGTGSLALELAPHVAHVDAVDVSSEMVRIARGKAEASATKNVTFHVGTLEEQAFEDAGYDVVCAYNILHLVPDREGTLGLLRRLLKPGGLFVSSTVCLGGTWFPPYPLIIPIMQWVGKAPSVQFVSPKAMTDEVRDAGFANVTRHDVGAAETTLFLTAQRPPLSEHQQASERPAAP